MEKEKLTKKEQEQLEREKAEKKKKIKTIYTTLMFNVSFAFNYSFRFTLAEVTNYISLVKRDVAYFNYDFYWLDYVYIQ